MALPGGNWKARLTKVVRVLMQTSHGARVAVEVYPWPWAINQVLRYPNVVICRRETHCLKALNQFF